MKSILSAALLLAVSYSFGQNYNTTVTTGTSSPYKFNDASAVTLLEDDITDVLSSLQTIPFTFTFYGNPVSQYFASDNGYITFDTGASASDPANTSIPSAGGPNNAIYALWYDMELTIAGTDDEVRSFTYGTAPNRTHVIQWYSVQPTGTTQYVYAAIRLHECGDFDIVHNYSNASGLSATVGCEDSAGTNGTMIGSSPSFDIASGLTGDGADDVVYTFYWDQINYDLTITNSDLTQFAVVGSNIVSGGLTNNGATAITSFDLHYQVDGGAIISETVTSAVAANGGTYNFSHGAPWTVPSGGVTHTLCIWADNLNGMADERTCNDQLCVDLFSNNGVSGTRTVLLEEFTGSWCGYCPDGALKLEEMETSYATDFVGVSIHNGDAMTFSDGIQTGFNATSFPSGMINRTLVDGQAKEPFSRSYWDAEVSNQIGSYTPLDVTIASTFNSTSRELNIIVTADFLDFAGGDLRFVAMLVENGVTGSGSGYDQVNYYSSSGSAAGGASHPHYGDPDPIVGYVHDHVLRALPGGAFGNAGVIASPVSPGTNVSETFTMTVPSNIDENNMSVIGFVAYYSTDIGSRSILDVAEVIPTTFVSIEELTLANAIQVYPNPAEDLVNVTIDATLKSAFSLTLHDMTGKIIQTQSITSSSNALDLVDLSPGMYFINVKTSDGNAITKRLIVK
jgi:thiol-disulfide isomerase/thioredoxin